MDFFDSFGLYYWARACPRKLIIDDQRRQLSYAELAELTDRAAAGLRDMGVGPGDHVILSMPNCVEYAVLVFACLKLGALLICVNLQFKESELNHIGQLISPPKIAFFSRSIQVEILKKHFPHTTFVTVDPEHGDFGLLARLLAHEPDPNPTAFAPENEMAVVFTSGSTGMPKGAVLTVRNMHDQIVSLIARFHANSNDIVYIPGPLCQMSGLPWLLMTVMLGASAVTALRFDGANALQIIEKSRVSILTGVTTMFARQIAAYEAATEKPDISSLRTGALGGAPASRSYMQWFEQTANCRLLNTYGMTECPGILMGDYADSYALRSQKTGRPLANVEAKIFAPDGHELPPGETGELCCKSSGIAGRYYNDPEASVRLKDSNGWFHTGDLGVADKSGYFTITGRLKDTIIRGGYNVYPAELEHLSCLHGLVAMACALPVENEDLGQQIALFYQPLDGHVLPPEELRAYLVPKLAKFKLPDRIICLEQLPLLPSGKIDRRALLSLL